MGGSRSLLLGGRSLSSLAPPPYLSLFSLYPFRVYIPVLRLRSG